MAPFVFAATYASISPGSDLAMQYPGNQRAEGEIKGYKE